MSAGRLLPTSILRCKVSASNPPPLPVEDHSDECHSVHGLAAPSYWVVGIDPVWCECRDVRPLRCSRPHLAQSPAERVLLHIARVVRCPILGDPTPYGCALVREPSANSRSVHDGAACRRRADDDALLRP